MSVPVVEMGNTFIDIFNSLKEGNVEWWTIGTLAGDMLGVPASLIKDYAKGAIRLFDPAMAEKMDNVLYGSSYNSANKTYSAFLDKGDARSAKSMLTSIFAQYKTGYVSDNVADKIVRLEMSGFDIEVKQAMTSYVNADGATVSLNASQITAFKTYYAQADKAARELMSTGEFQTATQEEQAALLKRIYNAYYGFAKAKVVGEADSKVSALLAGTNGNVAIGKFLPMLSKISSIKANNAKSRKDLVLDYLRGKSLSKAEKTLLLYLAGYGLSDDAKKTVKAYLSMKGMTPKEAAAFLVEK